MADIRKSAQQDRRRAIVVNVDVRIDRRTTLERERRHFAV